MDTMTLTINLPEDVGAALRIKAKKNGQDVGTYVETLIATQMKRPTYRELFADVRESVTVSDEELEKHIDRAVVESRKSRR